MKQQKLFGAGYMPGAEPVPDFGLVVETQPASLAETEGRSDLP